MKLLKIILLIVIIGLIASISMNVMQALHKVNTEEANIIEEQIIEKALFDLDKNLDLTNKVTLNNIYIESKGNEEYRQYTMLIANDGLYLVGATLINNVLHYVDVEEKLI